MSGSFCTRCNAYVTEEHWYWMNDSRYTAGGKWRCRQAKRDANKRYSDRIKSDPDKLERRRQYHRDYHQRHPEMARYKSMVSGDSKKGRMCDISIESYRDMIAKPCYYCSVTECGGLDRINNERGHVWDNVVPCCEKCNNILGDLPIEAKEKLKAGLHEIQQENLLVDWVIPTKRSRQNV